MWATTVTLLRLSYMLNDFQIVEQKAAAVGFIDLTASLETPPSQPYSFFVLLPSSL